MALIVVDESHNFRNPLSNRWENLFTLISDHMAREGERPYILFLTATPINNTIWDLFWQVMLLVLENRKAFLREGITDLFKFFKEIDKEGEPSLLNDLMNEISWNEFAREVLGLSDNVVDGLLIAREEAPGLGLDGFLQTMIKGYALPSLSEERPLSLQEYEPYRRETEIIIQKLREYLEMAELRVGEEIRTRKRLEEELEKARTEMYRKIQEKQALIDKLTRSL